ncbi:hypothetical protein F5879DRAFT_118618 [Lentinula edodes]|nr:hypothetical protein F5879DRAFT_118618 [Lentinula edodes]
MTYISLAAFDILATSLVTNRMMQAIRGCGGFRKVARQNLSEYVLRSGVLYFGVVTTPQIIAVVLYFVPQGWIKSSFTTFEPRHGSYRSGDFRDSTALSSATFSCELLFPLSYLSSHRCYVNLDLRKNIFFYVLRLSSIMIARFLLGLREMNESRRESIPDEASLAGHYAVHI